MRSILTEAGALLGSAGEVVAASALARVAAASAAVLRAEGVVEFVVLAFVLILGRFFAALELGLVLLYGVGLLEVEGELGDVPGLLYVPVLAEVEFLGEIVYFLGLDGIERRAGVPFAVVVVVDGKTGVVGARIYEAEGHLRRAFGLDDGVEGLVGAVEKLNHGLHAVEAGESEKEIGVVFGVLDGELVAERFVPRAVDARGREGVDFQAVCCACLPRHVEAEA